MISRRPQAQDAWCSEQASSNMYAGEDGEVCVELGYVGKDLSASQAEQPERSKAGGWPAWFGEVPVDVGDLICRLCGRWLYLVTQIYAPTHVQRSLCVFGCNQAACSLRPEGWRVVRTQAPQPAIGAGDDGEPATTTASSNEAASAAGALPPTPLLPVPPATEPAADAWGADADVSWDAADAAFDGDGWGAEEGEWGTKVDARGGGVTATADIVALLEEQEKRSSDAQVGRTDVEAPARGESGATELKRDGGGGGGDSRKRAVKSRGPDSDSPTASATGETGGKERGPCFPARGVSFMPEPWGVESSGAADKDMQNRLRRYREQEEDRGLVAALDQALGLDDAGEAGGSRQGAGGGGAAGVGEKYERTPARAKAVMRFADRVARSPKQALRYAYGGQPLWSSSDPPKDDIPPCPCGATRVFEMQLMPALLLQLNVNDLAERESSERQAGNGKSCEPDGNRTPARTDHEANGDKGRRKSTPEPPASARGGIDVSARCPSGANPEGVRAESVDRERLRTLGMDWGVVAVWSCPRSCEESFEEYVVVQLPV
ncbi:unnamed protein product [Scytosiphon promiscuus]